MRLYGAKKGDWTSYLAHALARDWGVAPLPEIARTDKGKPFFPSFPGLHFNISHSKSLLLLAVSRRPVGVDIEDIRPRRDSLPGYALSPAEHDQYQALGGDWPAFYTLWTKKEAWCKYTGRGLRALWGQEPQTDGLYYASYAGENWRAAVCGEEKPPQTILWLEGESL